LLKKHQSFETERLILKPSAEEDALFFLELLNSPKWIQYIGDRNIKTIEASKDYIKNKMLPQLKKLGYSNYTLLRKIDNSKIGCCGLYDREGLDGIDIGFAFLPEYEKQGYAFEAANKLKKIAFNQFGLTKINAITSKENISSQKLLEKLGLILIGIKKLPNDHHESLLYQITK